MCGLPRYRWLGIRIGHDRRNELPKFWDFVFAPVGDEALGEGLSGE